MSDLYRLRTALVLSWRSITEFIPGTGVDGELVAEGVRYPLDLWTPDEAEGWEVIDCEEGGGSLVVEPDALRSMNDVLAAVNKWTAQHLGRSDVLLETQ